jgi:hypothetical protein
MRQIDLLSFHAEQPLQVSAEDTCELWMTVNEELRLCVIDENE